jgi:hypothetical protein
MPTAKPAKDDAPEPTPQPKEAAAPAPEPGAETPATTEPAGPEPGVYEYTHFDDCVYPHVPLTCHAGRPERPATDDAPGEPEVKATVFDWPFGAPDDGRWKPTRKKPTQAADNAGPLPRRSDRCPHPTTYAPAKQFVGIANETTQGTAVAMTTTILVDEFKPKDNPTFLEDKSWRGSMGTDAFAPDRRNEDRRTRTRRPRLRRRPRLLPAQHPRRHVRHRHPTGSGHHPVRHGGGRRDQHQHRRVDPRGTVVQIGTGATAEVFTTGTPTGAGPYTIPLSTPPAASSTGTRPRRPCSPVTGPYTYAQPPQLRHGAARSATPSRTSSARPRRPAPASTRASASPSSA